MASKQHSNTTAAHSKNKFAETLHTIGYRFSLSSVLDDFLTMSIAACTQNLHTKKSWYEDEYLETIGKYKGSEVRHEFPKAFAYLVTEMEERVGSSLGNDVLGDFFEQNISNGRNGQFFTPYPICQFMASIAHTDQVCDSETIESIRILDPACGSGRMLLASHRINGPGNEYYGIDIDRTCVKMTALNLFLNGVWNSEVMCANSLAPDDFVISYRISFIPLGIFKIEEKEQSKLWHLHKNSFPIRKNNATGASIILDSTPFSERTKDDGTQLNLF
jgi:type I restriction-modification system DNA methylase subunit